MERDLSQKLIDVLERVAAALERLAPQEETPEARQEETPEKAPAKAKNKEVK